MLNQQQLYILKLHNYSVEQTPWGTIDIKPNYRCNFVHLSIDKDELVLHSVSSHWRFDDAKQFAKETKEAFEIMELVKLCE